MMNYEQAMHYLEGTERFGSRLGLERMRELLNYLGSPERGKLCMHVAGTNGKGSVSAYSAYMLAAAGLRVGLYCSPYVYDFGERIRILDGRDPEGRWKNDPREGQISHEAIAETLSEIRRQVEKHGMTGESHPTHFEMLTLMAFLYFDKNDCDVWVLETGLGGRLDSTNVIPAPKVAVITAIGLDHTKRLGSTYTAIASEKAGILKKGTEHVLVYDQYLAISDKHEAEKVENVFKERAKELGIEISFHRHEEIERLEHGLNGQRFRLKSEPSEIFETKLLPDFEADNADLAIKAVKALRPEITQDEIKEGLSLCYWPARLEKLCDEPVVLVDGGHNPQGAKALRLSLQSLFPDGRKEVHVCSVMKDKDRENMFRQVFAGGSMERIYFTAPQGIARAERPENLAETAREVAGLMPPEERPEILTAASVKDAVEAAWDYCRENEAVLLAWGTFYQAGEFRDAVYEAMRSRS